MKYLKFSVVLILVIVLLFLFFRNVEFGKVMSIIKNVNPLYILVFIFGIYSQFFIRAYRWGVLFRPYKKKISLLNLYHYSYIGMFVNTLIPGKLGEPARGVLIAKEEGLEAGTGLATIVIERLIDSLMIFVLFFTSLLFINSGSSPLLGKLKTLGVIFLPAAVMIFFIFYLINVPAVFNIIEKIIKWLVRLFPVSSRDRVRGFLVDFVKGLELKLGFTDSLKLLFSSILVWTYLVPFYWYLMQGFGFGKSLSILDTVPYFSLIVMSAAVPTPGMAGSLDAASKHGLLELYRDQAGKSIVTVNEAAAYTLLIHILIIMIIIIAGFVSFSSKGLKMSSVKKAGAGKNEMS